MREKRTTLVKVHLITILMTFCSAGTGCLPGAAYAAAVFEERTAGWLGIVVSEAVMFFCADFVTFTEYTGILAVTVAFTQISRIMRIRTGDDARQRSIYVGLATFLLELTKRLFEVWSLSQMSQAVWYGIACGILSYLFHRGVMALLDGNAAFLRQKSETMISAACFLGAASYAVLSADLLPDFVKQAGICLLLLYLGYSYGPAMGAVTGAAVGIILSFLSGEIACLGILCFLGLVAGLFRDLGRFAQTIAFFAGTAALLFCGVPFLAQLRWLAGVLAAGGLWIGLDILTTTIRRGRGKKEDAECAGTLAQPGKEDVEAFPRPEREYMGMSRPQEKELAAGFEGRQAESAGRTGAGQAAEALRECAGEILKEAKKEEPGAAWTEAPLEEATPEELAVRGRYWETKYQELRETLAVQMLETAKILEDCETGKEARATFDGERAEKLKARLSERGIQMSGMLRGQEPDGRKTCRFLWKRQSAGKRKSGQPIMVKDLIPVLNDVLEGRYEPADGQLSLVGRKEAAYDFIETPYFRILHASASTKKNEAAASGDAFGVTRMGNGQILFGIADGVGSGQDAAKSAARTFDMLELLLKSGLTEEISLRLMDTLELTSGEEQGAALDFGVLNLNTGICHLMKAGGPASFIRRHQWVEMIRGKTLPLGMMPGTHYESSVQKMYDGDMIFLVSDGVIQAFPGEEKEMQIGTFLMETDGLGPKEMAGSLLERALSFGKAADDMSVLAIGVYETQPL